MKLTELEQELKTLGYPVVYSHFKSKQKPPFIIYLVDDTDNFNADNITYHKVLNVDIELYVTKKEVQVEEKIEKLLNDNELPYEFDEFYIESEGVFKCVFSIQLI